MPTRVNKVCTTPGCPNAGAYRGKCSEHATAREAVRNERRADSRRVYLSVRWKRLRRIVLLEQPHCAWAEQVCWLPSVEVDHVIPIEDGGDPWDRGNLQGLCHGHHAVKSSRESRARPSD